MGSPLQLAGQKFGRLLVIERGQKKNGAYLWLCQCDCGNIKYILGSSIKAGTSKSCGCLQIEVARSYKKENARGTHPLYEIYSGIKGRCLNTKDDVYNRYGGRGITISKEWLDSFEQFVEDVGERPDSTYSLDRIDNNGNYCKGNTRWVKADKQARNQRKYKNNSSGVTGVNLLKTKHGNYWTARVSHPLHDYEITKSFSIKKLGNDEAFKLACEHREYLIKMLNQEFDAGYSDSHGK